MKKDKPARNSEEPAAQVQVEPEPWTCSSCGAPGLERAVRVGTKTLCTPCFYDSDFKSGRFVSRNARRA